MSTTWWYEDKDIIEENEMKWNGVNVDFLEF